MVDELGSPNTRRRDRRLTSSIGSPEGVGTPCGRHPRVGAIDEVHPRPSRSRAPDRYVAKMHARNSGVGPAEGDLIFGNRLSWMQGVMNVSGDFLSHIGIVAVVDGELSVIELGPGGCFTRSYEVFTKAYRFHALARPQMHPQCLAEVVRVAKRHLQTRELTYSMNACSLLEVFMLARRYSPQRAEEGINRLGVRAASWLVKRSPATDVTCSGFVYECLSAACSQCRPMVTWPTRERVAPWCAAPSLTDVRASRSDRGTQQPEVVRTLITPYDLWAAVQYQFKLVVDDDLATLIQDDLDDPSPMSIAS